MLGGNWRIGAIASVMTGTSTSGSRRPRSGWCTRVARITVGISHSGGVVRLPVVNKPFEQVVAEYGPVVLRVCRALLGPVDAEDAWSETFLSALRAYPDLAPDSNVEAWLVTIAHRKAVDAHRARAKRPVPTGELPETATRDSDGGDGDGGDGELWEALRALPTTQCAAVAYHYLAGLPYAQVADILGNSEAAARRAAADGMRKLRSTYHRSSGQRKGEHR